jgi:hypothetical protein
MEERIAQLESAIAEIQKFMAAFNIDKQIFIHKDNTTPGMGTKVSVNSDGLVTDVKDLSPSDIPTLPISKIDGLPERLDDTVSRSQMNLLDDKIAKVLNHGDTIKTGAKVNVDGNGLVNEVMNLSQEDIPQLNMDKINGLAEAINMMKSTLATKQEQPTTVQQVQQIEVPESLIKRVSAIESSLANKANKDELSPIYNELGNKCDKRHTESGSYAVVDVDNNGFVTGGRQLAPKDLPPITIMDVEGLYDKLALIIDRNDFLKLSAEVSSLASRMKRLDEIMELETSLQATIKKVNDIQRKVNELDATLDRVLHDRTIKDEILSINKDINILKSSLK